MTKEEYWFAVGFIAGEGYIGCNPDLIISVNQTEEKPLLFLQAIFGGTFAKPQFRNNPKHNTRWEWRATGGRAAGIIMTLIPGLGQVHEHKYNQAVEAMKTWKTKKLPAAKRTHCPQGHEYNKENTFRTPDNYRQCLVCAKHRTAASNAKRRNLIKGELHEPTTSVI